MAVHFLNSGFSAHGTSLQAFANIGCDVKMFQVQCGSGPAPVWAKVSRDLGSPSVVLIAEAVPAENAP